MEKKILTEIKKIKNLMGLNEQSEQECEDFLVGKGYRVIDPEEIEDRNLKCGEKPKIKCAVEKFVKANKSYGVNKMGNMCYVKYTSDKTVAEGYPKWTKVCWENGVYSMIGTFENVQDVEVDGKTMYFLQFMYEGKWQCDENKFTFSDLKYMGVFEKDNLGKIHKDTAIYIDKDSANPSNKVIKKTSGNIL